LAAVWMRRGIEESPEWIRARSLARGPVTPLRAIFSRDYLKFTILLTALSTATIFAYWGLNLWVPAYLSLPPAQGGAGFTAGVTTTLVVLIQFGAFLGYVSFGWVADALGRRRSFLIYLLTASILVLGFGQTQNPWAVALLGPLTTFFGTGFFSGFGAVSAELYPTAIRATAQGFTYNVGRMGSALAPFVVGTLAETQGFGVAFALLAIALLLGAATWIWLPESLGWSVATRVPARAAAS
jgi:MFS family permease